MYQNIFLISKKKKKKKNRQKPKEIKWEKKISVENLTGYEANDCYLLCVLLTYLIESWISPGCYIEFNIVYVQREKYSICFTTAIYELYTFKNKNERKLLRDIFVYHFLFYICLFVAANLL